jgi:hypothetical protein
MSLPYWVAVLALEDDRLRGHKQPADRMPVFGSSGLHSAAQQRRSNGLAVYHFSLDPGSTGVAPWA